ncbi:MAG: glycosyltransferase family 1 protein, partial [Bacteroidota bacterium]
PVITSKGSAMTEAGGPGALYVDPFDVEDIAHKIQRVLEEEQVRQELMQKGYPYALKKFNGKTFADHTMAIYQKLMG